MLLDRCHQIKLLGQCPTVWLKSIYITWQKKNDTEVCLPTTYMTDWLELTDDHILSPFAWPIYTIYDRHCKRAAKDPTKYDETMCKLGNPKKQKRVRYCHPSHSPSSLIPWSSPLTLYIHIYKYTYIHVSTLCCKPIVLFLSLSTSPLRTMDYELVFEFDFWTWPIDGQKMCIGL